MIYLKYLLLIILGWILSIIIGGILGAIFNSNKSKTGGFIAGLLNPFLTVLLIGFLLVEQTSSGTYNILPLVLILLPLILINIQAYYNSRLQDKSGNYVLPVTGLKLKINKGLVIGT